MNVFAAWLKIGCNVLLSLSTPKVMLHMKYIDGYRQDVIQLLSKNSGNVGIELGVATGTFSERMMQSGAFDSFFGVDMYADHHNVEEYKLALRRVGLFSNYKLLRMKFSEALDLFPDGSLDFVYIDGYAHTGEEDGETIRSWASKVKVGGVIAGDDYAPKWPLVISAVDCFILETGFDLFLTTKTETTPYCLYPSWATVKRRNYVGNVISEFGELAGKD